MVVMYGTVGRLESKVDEKFTATQLRMDRQYEAIGLLTAQIKVMNDLMSRHIFDSGIHKSHLGNNAKKNPE
jgi:hypothetical protein